MKFPRVSVALSIALSLALPCAVPRSTSADEGPIKIAVITDMNGVYAATTGKGAITSAQMAVDDFGGSLLGRKLEVLAIDHQNNGPTAASKAREAFDNGAEVAVDLTNSATALAVSAVAKEKHKLVLVTGAGSSAITGAACSKYTYHYMYDTYALASSTGRNLARGGGKTWYGIVPDYAFGKAMLTDFTAAIKPEGGSFVHSDMIPVGNTDFSSYLLAAKQSHAQVLGVLNAGLDTTNTMKGVKQFGIDKDMKVAIGLLFQSDVDTQPDLYTGSRITTGWFWNMDKAATAWANRWTAKMGGGVRPGMTQAADYSAISQWLQAVKAVGSTDGDKLVSYLDGRQFSDPIMHAAEWRARDHRVTHEMYVVDVLPKDKIKQPGAWFKLVQVIAPGRAFRPESESPCVKSW